MITHIVFWKLIDDDTHNAEENAARIKRELEALAGGVPGLLSAQVGQGVDAGESELLCSDESDSAADPDHVKVADFVHTAVSARTALDFENDNILDSGIDPYVF